MKKLKIKNLTSQNATHITQKGITLVALVITIIVLLILAGVAINMAINSDGLFGKANEATQKWNESVEKEETAISDLLAELDKVSPMAVEISTNIPEGWDKNKVSAVAIAGSRKAPIPVGFTVSSIEGENTIGGGLVIYEGADAVTDEDTDNDGFIDAQEERNQFVWIPVDDINQMIMCKLNNANDDGTICNLTRIEVSDGYSLKCNTHNSTDLAGRLYSTDAIKTNYNGIHEVKLNFTRQDPYKVNFRNREPDNLTNKTNGDASVQGLAEITKILKAEGKTYEGTVTYDTIKSDWLALQQKDFDAMAKSVARYGGFYISRYEIGAGGISKKNKDVLINNSNANNWWGMYSQLRTEGKTMIWGSQYDQVIKFIGEPAQIGHNNRNLYSTPQKSGINGLDILNNIYDLEGNMKEWTIQPTANYARMSRGSNYENVRKGEYYPASGYDDDAPTATDGYCSSRVSIYL